MKDYIPLYMSIVDVARKYQIDHQTVWERVQNGTLPSPVKLASGLYRWEVKRLREWEGTVAEQLDAIKKDYSINKWMIPPRNDLILTKEEIINGMVVGEAVVGVYFLIGIKKSSIQIVYVGQSTNVLSRIATHLRNPGKKFKFIFYIRCMESELNNLEMFYIKKFKPIYNKSGNGGCFCLKRSKS